MKTQMEKDSAFWQALCKRLPWQLSGFTERKEAQYQTGKYTGIVLTASQRTAILKAIKGV